MGKEIGNHGNKILDRKGCLAWSAIDPLRNKFNERDTRGRKVEEDNYNFNRDQSVEEEEMVDSKRVSI